MRFLRAIKEAQAIGFTLAEIEEYLRVARSGPASEALRTRAAAKIDEIDARIARLRRMRDELARIVGCACDSLDHCTCGAAYLARRGREAPVRAVAAARHQRRERGEHAAADRAGRRGAALAGRAARGAGAGRAAARAAAGPRGVPLRVRLGEQRGRSWPRWSAGTGSSSGAADGQQVVLWFEHDLYDQLQLVDALALAADAGGAPELIVVGSFPGKPAFRGLGELTADELETLWPSRRAATPGHAGRGGLGLGRLRQPDPSALAAVASGGPPRAAVPRGPRCSGCSRSCPRPGDGLSGTERRALQAIAAGAATPAAAFLAAQDLEAAPFLGDAWFFRALAGLGAGAARLVETQAGDPLPPPPPLGDARAFARLPLRLTDAGERVLDGRDDRVALLGLDRWLGGTHLTAGRRLALGPRRPPPRPARLTGRSPVYQDRPALPLPRQEHFAGKAGAYP